LAFEGVVIGQGAKIVIGDSDRAVLELLQIRFDLAGYHACVARDAQGVLEQLRSVRPAALVIDMGIAGLNAFDVLRTLGDPAYPILLMGRNMAADDVRRAVGLGVRDCLAKPFGAADALERVGRLLRAARPQAVA
jgi:two-component system catabolic regulation response regulator CreB